MTKFEKVEKSKITYVFCIFLIAICSFWNSPFGIDLTDTGYTLMGFDNPWMSYSIIGANGFGYFITHVLGINNLLGIRFIFNGLLFISAMMIWHILKKHISIISSSVGLSAGIIISFYLPHTIAYDYLTVVLIAFTIFFMYYGIFENKNLFLMISSICIGLSVYVRISNLVFVLLYLGIIYYHNLVSVNIKNRVVDFLFFFLGFIIGLLIGVIILSYYGHFNDYINSIIGLNTQSTYKSYNHSYSSLIRSYIEHYCNSLKNGALIVLIGLFCGLIKKITNVVAKLVFFSIIAFISIIVITYHFGSAIMVLFGFCVIISLYQIIVSDCSYVYKTMLTISLITVMITPCGSNVCHLYLIDLFLLLPFVFDFILNLLSTEFSPFSNLDIKSVAKYFICAVSVLMVVLCGLCSVKIYRDSYIFNLNTQVNCKRVYGIYTTSNKAKIYNDLFKNLDEMDFDQTITYGAIPTVSWMIDKPSAISSSWLDLGSYSKDTFKTDLKNIKENKKVAIIVAKSNTAEAIEGGIWDNKSFAHPNLLKKGELDEKWDILFDYIEDNNYSVKYNSDYFTVYTN